MRRFVFGMRAGVIGAATLSCLWGAGSAIAAGATWLPERPMRMVVPLAPGGSNDFLARLIARHVQDATAQPVIVDNRPGAGGNIGTDIVAKARPDGYTLVCANVSSIAINGALYAQMPYDPVTDLSPVTLVAVFPNLLLVRANARAQNLKDLIALSREQRDGFTFASAGQGSTTHLSAEMLGMMAGARWRHIPYKGGGPALSALISGEVTMFFGGVPAVRGHLDAGRVRALGISSRQRWPALPDVPTIAESGYPDYEALNWAGVLAPAGTPAPVLDWWNAQVTTLLKDPETAALLSRRGARASPQSRAEFASFIRSEIDKWTKVVAASGARL